MQYLVDYLMEVGPTESGGMGPAPISWQELDAWARRVPRGLQPWDFITMRRLSELWVAEMARAEAPDAPAPYDPAPTPQQRIAVGDSLRDSIRAMAGKGKAK